MVGIGLASVGILSPVLAAAAESLPDVLSDPTRIKIVFALSRAELCVCDIAVVVGLSISAISHQLRLLRSLNLVKYRKEGRWAYYSLDDDHTARLLQDVLEHVRRAAAVLILAIDL